MLLGRFVNPDENFVLYLILEYGVTILLGIVIYFAAFAPYRRFLRDSYGYGLTSGPTKLGVFGVGAVFALQFFGVNDLSFIPVDLPIFKPNPDAGTYALMVLACALPGVLLATLWCLVKTRNLLVAAINIPILFIYCFLCGYLIIFYVAALILGVMGVGMFAGLVAGPGASKTRWRRTDGEESSGGDFYYR